MRRAVLALAGLWLAVAPASAQDLVADLSSHLIAITTGFTGTDVVLFGTVDEPGDVAVVVQGPEQTVTVRRKDRVAGIWINHASLTFERVPSLYSVATTRPLDEIVPDPVLARHEIGLDHLRVAPTEPVDPETLAEFRAALIQQLQKEGVYALEPGHVTFLGTHLFRTNIYFPANVPTGIYQVSVYLLREGDVVSAQTTPLVVSKVGVSAEIYEFALARSALYGLLALASALAAGWAAGAFFRRA